MSTNSDILTASELNHFLREVYDKGYTTKTLKLNRPLYNEVAERTFMYCLERAETHKSFLVAMNEDPAEIAGMITMRILDRFDSLWTRKNGKAPNPAGLAVVATKNSIYDTGRTYKRKMDHTHSLPIDDLIEDILLDSAVLLSAEESYMQSLDRIEDREKILYIVDKIPSRTLFQAVSFFTTQVLAVTPKLLASQLDQYGLRQVAKLSFPLLAKALDIPVSKLTDCTYRHTTMPTYTTLKQLAAKISSASHMCKLALMKDVVPHFTIS